MPVKPALTRRSFLAGAVALAVSEASARMIGTVKFDEAVRLSGDGPLVTLAGAGEYRFFFVRYYACALYAMPGLADARAILAADAPRRLTLQALRRISAFEFLWALDHGLGDNLSAAELQSVAEDLDRIRRAIRAAGGIDAGVRLAIDYVPASGVRLLIDDVERGIVSPGKLLADALFKIWIGERPLDAALKQALLGH